MKGVCPLSRLRVHAFSISLDGFGAGPHQDAEHPLGVGGIALHDWVVPLHLAMTPALLGSGEHLLTGIDLPALGYECTEHVSTAATTHVVLTRRK